MARLMQAPAFSGSAWPKTLMTLRSWLGFEKGNCPQPEKEMAFAADRNNINSTTLLFLNIQNIIN